MASSLIPSAGQSLQGGSLPRLDPNSTNEEQVAVINDIVDRLNASLKTQVFSDSTNKRMLIGFQKDGWGAGNDFGIKVSLPGVDVTLATDTQLLFRMATDNWAWRNSSGQLIRTFDISGGAETWIDALSQVPTIRIGSAPTFDKRAGTWVAKPGQSVTTLLGG